MSARGEEIMRLVPLVALSQSDIAPLRAAVELLVREAEQAQTAPADIGTAEQLAERMYMADRRRQINEAEDKFAAKLHWGPWDESSYETQQKYLRWARLAWELREFSAGGWLVRVL
jgi:hypothetical protein